MRVSAGKGYGAQRHSGACRNLSFYRRGAEDAEFLKHNAHNDISPLCHSGEGRNLMWFFLAVEVFALLRPQAPWTPACAGVTGLGGAGSFAFRLMYSIYRLTIFV